MRPRSLSSLASVTLLGALVAAPALAQPGVPVPVAPAPPPTIAVGAVGEEQVVPDRARISIGVQTQAPTAADAAARNARLQRAVIDTLRALGLAAEQITTMGYNVFPEQQFDQPTRRTRIVGYNVQNTVVAELRNIQQVGPALDAVLAKGANLVSSLAFYSSQQEAVRRRALQRAVERARADAMAMAQAAGGRIGELVELSSGFSSGGPRPMADVTMAMSRSAEAVPTPISEGSQTVTATVSARWRFVAGP